MDKVAADTIRTAARELGREVGEVLAVGVAAVAAVLAVLGPVFSALAADRGAEPGKKVDGGLRAREST